jgi:PhzF family phenazine biosynthesis protein
MSALRFHLVNVFAGPPLSGNALAVFEDGRDLTDEQMQALALQLNLSETTFLLPSTRATARLRIFTPAFEMPFAGHPTLGSAQVARSLLGCGDRITLETRAGVIPLSARGDDWTLRANPPRTRPVEATPTELATMLGVSANDVGARPMWVDTGSEQLVVELSTPTAVERCRPDAVLLAQRGSNAERAGLVYVWARRGEDTGRVLARFFSLEHGAIVEDPGTGSACANLGGWLVETRHELPLSLVIEQGSQTGRPCTLRLHVDVDRQILVTGRVVEIGSGTITL